MTIRERITEYQHGLDGYLQLYQEFVNELNMDESLSDEYRRALLQNVENMKKSIFTVYKKALDIKSSRDFDIPYENEERGDERRR